MPSDSKQANYVVDRGSGDDHAGNCHVAGNDSKLVVSGHTGSIPVSQINGKNYVQVEALAQLVSGTLSYGTNQMTLTLGGNEPAAAEEKAGLSRDFLRAAIEEMSTLREWHTALFNCRRESVSGDTGGIGTE